MKVLGYRILEGSYNGVPFKTVHVSVQKEGNGIYGTFAVNEKINYDNFKAILDEQKIPLEKFIGLDLNFYYDKWGKVNYFTII